ncbi:endocuticle structural glycoprotein SgAbd-4-like [Rhynchophorus ferrugineus]|uniref:endocuticle structural glycoprotein SgAbd-4-like n=1 Tax=Rhynchophorus ferrugineus TaxID=354439 RepID=UPI003FCC3339
MIRLVIVTAFIAFAAAANRPFGRPLSPQAPAQFAAILRSDSDINPDGSYYYSYETENGIEAQEQGSLKSLPEGAGTAAQGFYRYTSPEGVPVSVQYVADENGFQPQSDILPTPPPIPSYILRALEYNARHPEPTNPPSYRRY